MHTQTLTYMYVLNCLLQKHFTRPVNRQIFELYKMPATILDGRNTSMNKKDKISALMEFPLILKILGYSVRC